LAPNRTKRRARTRARYRKPIASSNARVASSIGLRLQRYNQSLSDSIASRANGAPSPHIAGVTMIATATAVSATRTRENSAGMGRAPDLRNVNSNGWEGNDAECEHHKVTHDCGSPVCALSTRIASNTHRPATANGSRSSAAVQRSAKLQKSLRGALRPHIPQRATTTRPGSLTTRLPSGQCIGPQLFCEPLLRSELLRRSR